MKDKTIHERLIAQNLRDKFFRGWRVFRVSFKIKSGRSEAVFRAEGPDGRKLAIKHCAHPRKAIEEFIALQSLSAARGDCIRPVFLDEQASVFAMEWIEAATLKQMMQRPRRLDLIRQAGRWLKGLHSATRCWTPRRDRQIEGDLLIGPQGGEFKKIDAILRNRRTRLGLRLHRHSLLHTDFHMGNLFVDGERIIAFDPMTSRRGLPVHDVADFLVLCEVYRLHAAMRGDGWPDCGGQDRRAFLDGYGALKPRRKRLLDFALDVKIARMWHHHAKADTRAPLADAEFLHLSKRMRQRGLLHPVD